MMGSLVHELRSDRMLGSLAWEQRMTAMVAEDQSLEGRWNAEERLREERLWEERLRDVMTEELRARRLEEDKRQETDDMVVDAPALSVSGG